ncbi:MAG: 3-hydroxyacyl-ACP dehydratase FabZ family protein [Rubripirellula sp.]
MPKYHHEFPHVEDYLHHRAPYLLVENIVSIEDDCVITERTVSGQENFLQGHFPGAPIFPGAMLQELTTQSAGILIAARHNPMQEYNTHDPDFNEFALGVLVRVKQARYKGFARPGDQLRVKVQMQDEVSQVFDFAASVLANGTTIMRNRFQLTNIPSKLLSGTQ